MESKFTQWIAGWLGWIIAGLFSILVALVSYIWGIHEHRIRSLERKVSDPRVLLVRFENLSSQVEDLLARQEAMFEKMEHYHAQNTLRIDKFIAAIIAQR